MQYNPDFIYKGKKRENNTHINNNNNKKETNNSKLNLPNARLANEFKLSNIKGRVPCKQNVKCSILNVWLSSDYSCSICNINKLKGMVPQILLKFYRFRTIVFHFSIDSFFKIIKINSLKIISILQTFLTDFKRASKERTFELFETNISEK